MRCMITTRPLSLLGTKTSGDSECHVANAKHDSPTSETELRCQYGANNFFHKSLNKWLELKIIPPCTYDRTTIIYVLRSLSDCVLIANLIRSYYLLNESRISAICTQACVPGAPGLGREQVFRTAKYCISRICVYVYIHTYYDRIPGTKIKYIYQWYIYIDQQVP